MYRMNRFHRTIDPTLIFTVGSFLILFVFSLCTKRGGLPVKSNGHDPNRTTLLLYPKVAGTVADCCYCTVLSRWPPGTGSRARSRNFPHRYRKSRTDLNVTFCTEHVCDGCVGNLILLTLLPVRRVTQHADLVFLGVFGAIVYNDIWRGRFFRL